MDINLLFSLLYFCDFNYYEIHEEQLTGLLYKKESFGPSSGQALSLINEMKLEKKIQSFKSSYAGIPHIRYLPGTIADLKLINAAEKLVIDRVIEQYSDWSSSSLSRYAREDMPWKATTPGKAIDYELVFYRRPPYSVRTYEEDFE